MRLALAYISHIYIIVLIIECVLEVNSQEEETLLFESVSSTEPVYRLNPFASCAGTEPELLVWIHSSAMNVRRRNAIRNTWGRRDYYGPYDSKLIFFVGLPSFGAKANLTVRRRREKEIMLQKQLEFEFEMYGDIVQGEFMDTYRNMTHKAIHSLRWISLYCSTAKFIMKIDDDIIVNIFKLLPYLRLKQVKKYYPQNVISCNLWRNAEPARDPNSKWYISEEEYPAETYPPFCQGMVYFITPDLVPRLYNASFYESYLFMDDVYITGLLANRLKNPQVEFRKLSAEYARVYGIGNRVIPFIEKNKDKVTFVHTDSVDSYLISWDIIESANQHWDINKLAAPYIKPAAAVRRVPAMQRGAS